MPLQTEELSSTDRGKIRNREQARQIRDFSGLRWGKITPSDIDGFVEFHDDVFIFYEIKHHGANLPEGQELALTRLVDQISKNKPTILLIARHDNPPEEDIDAANCLVISYYYCKKWIEPKERWTVRQFSDWFIESNLGYLPK